MLRDLRLALARKTVRLLAGLVAAAVFLVGALFILLAGDTADQSPATSPNTLCVAATASSGPLPGGQSPARAVTLTSRQKWDVGNPWFSPDGSAFFAFTTGLVVGKSDGTQVRMLEPNAIAALWAPDSRTLAVAVASGPLASETQQVPIYLMATDGSCRSPVGTTDQARRIQVLQSGKVAFVLGGQLHLFDPSSSRDSVLPGVTVAPDPTNDVPFLFAPDAGAVAVLRGTTLTVTDVASQANQVLTSSIDSRRWSSYEWSPDGETLAYSDVSADRTPEIVLYDRRTGARTRLLKGNEAGVYGGLSWAANSGWLLFVFYGTGTGVEEQSSYEAVNVSKGDHTVLFKGGLGLRLSPDGTRITYSITAGDASQDGSWVASLSFQP